MGDKEDRQNPAKPVRKQDPYVTGSDSSGDTVNAGGCMVVAAAMAALAVLGAATLAKKVKR